MTNWKLRSIEGGGKEIRLDVLKSSIKDSNDVDCRRIYLLVQ